MLGFKSLEAKLRDGDGRTAAATVLGMEKGKSLHWKSETGPHGSGNYVEEGTVSKDRYRLEVRPDGEPAFEAAVKIREDEFFGRYALHVRSILGLGYADTFVMALAERERLPVLTFDFQHFRAAAPRDGLWQLVIDEHRYELHTRS